ncbi:hypothetical protein [Pseudomonas aeruginosa]|uniref:hypothetical protein n=1 Tax=Pseudomonas aeruginosa TaxID=287 RepID=UPI0036E9DC05
MRRSLLFCGALLASLCAWAEPAQVRLLSSDFVLPGKHQRLAGWAREAGVELRGLRLGIGDAPPGDWLDGGDLLILDTPRPTDRAQVERALGERLQGGTQPWIRVGGGPPGFGNLPAALGGRLVGYYANGGEANLRRLFEAVRRWHAGLTSTRCRRRSPWRRPASIIPTHRRRSPASPTTWPGAPRAGPAMPRASPS